MDDPDTLDPRHGDRSNDALAEALTTLAVAQMQVATAVRLLADAVEASPIVRQRLLLNARREADAALRRSAEVAAPFLGADDQIRDPEDLADE